MSGSSLYEEFMRYIASSEHARRAVDRLFAEADKSIIMQSVMVRCFNKVFMKWLLLRGTHSPDKYAREIEECVRDGYD